MAKYHISRKAIADLDSIWEYTAKEWSEQQASEYYRQLYFSLQNLSGLPSFLARTIARLKRDFWVIESVIISSSSKSMTMVQSG